MGLDFYVIKIQKGYSGKPWDVFRSWSHDDWDKNTLCYGRKSWELVRELRCDIRNECVSELMLDDWINLQDKLAPIGPSLERIHDAYNANWDGNASTEDRWIMNQYEKWYDACFDDFPTLGYDFSVGYMETFWEKADEVLKYLEDPDWEVWMIASY